MAAFSTASPSVLPPTFASISCCRRDLAVCDAAIASARRDFARASAVAAATCELRNCARSRSSTALCSGTLATHDTCATLGSVHTMVVHLRHARANCTFAATCSSRRTRSCLSAYAIQRLSARAISRFRNRRTATSTSLTTWTRRSSSPAGSSSGNEGCVWDETGGVERDRRGPRILGDPTYSNGSYGSKGSCLII
eukprot:SAG31_NODE_861_length_11418_cov_5.107430_2_plen_196_part_00